MENIIIKTDNSNIIVLPSDHQINNEEEFLSVLTDANEFVNKED